VTPAGESRWQLDGPQKRRPEAAAVSSSKLLLLGREVCYVGDRLWHQFARCTGCVLDDMNGL
jgi:hypothetical protein